MRLRKYLIGFIIFFLFSNLSFSQGITYAEKESNNINLQEMKDLRTQHSKVYINTENAKTVEKIFSQSVHYKNSMGQWEDIDTTISAASNFNDQYSNVVDKNNYKLSLNKRSDKALKFSYQNSYVKYLPINTNKKEAIITKNESIFKDAWKATELQYIVQNDGIKMNLLLNDESAPKKFEFEVSSNLTIIQSSTGTKFIDGENKEFFIIPKMWVSDQSEPSLERSDRIKEELTHRNGKTILSITLNDKGLIYPLMIDPTTQLSSYSYLSDYNPGDLVAENLTSPLISGYIDNISIYADYVDPTHGPELDPNVPVELYANSNKLQETFVCYSSCKKPNEYSALGAVKISTLGQTNVEANQIINNLGDNFTINGLTIYGSRIGHYNITITYGTNKIRPPNNVKVERLNNTQLKISWDITQANKKYRVKNSSRVLLEETTNNFVIVNLSAQNRFYVTAYDPVSKQESNEVYVTFDAISSLTYIYTNGRLERVVNTKTYKSIYYIYDANGNLIRKYSSS